MIFKYSKRFRFAPSFNNRDNDRKKRYTKRNKEIVTLDEEIGQLEKTAGSYDNSAANIGIKTTCEMDKVSILVRSDNYVELSDEESENSDETRSKVLRS